MIQDALVILFSFILGYAIFLTSTYLLAKWMLPRITDEKDLVLPGTSEKHVRHTVKGGQYLYR